MKSDHKLFFYAKTLAALITVVVSVAFVLPAYADTTINGKISTLGFGLEGALPVTNSIDARIGFNYLNYSFDNKSTSSGNGNDTYYSGTLKLNTFEALADWHPFQGSFRISGGLMYNKNDLKATGQGNNGTISIGGTDYPIGPGEYVNAEVDFNKMAPYFGIGWGRTPENTGLSFTSDIGILFQGTPKGNVSTNIPNVAQSDIDQANSDLNDQISKFKYYPVISFGIGYTF